LARFLALDWDHNQLYVVLGNVRSGKVTLERAASWTEERSPNPADGELLGKVLRERLKAAGIPTAPVLACIGRDRLNLKEVRYPANVASNDEPALVRMKAESELNQPASEVVFDYAPAGLSNTGEKRALVMVVPRDLVTAYQELCKSAGLKLAGLTPRTFGLAAAGRRAMAAALLAPEAGDTAYATVAVTERWAEFVIVHGQNVLMTRMLNVGPQLSREIQRNLAVYAGQAPSAPVRALCLTGVDVEPLKTNLNAVLDVPVHLFEPFGGAEGAGLPDVNRGAYVAAVGLLQAQSDGALPVNLANVRQPIVVQDPNKKRMVAGVALALLLMVATFAFGFILDNGLVIAGTVYYAGNAQQLAAIALDKEKVEKDTKDLQEINRKTKALEDWDGLPQVDEFYDLTWRIADVNLLPITKITVSHVRDLRTDPKKRTEKKRDYVDLYVLEGTLLDKNRKPLDDLADAYRADHGYLVEPPEIKPGNKFSLRVYAERRAPEAYKHALPAAPKPKENKPADPGDFDDQ
jgi:Tfp pilus assembly PilM family ATPase